jgi:hypothetical protein
MSPTYTQYSLTRYNFHGAYAHMDQTSPSETRTVQDVGAMPPCGSIQSKQGTHEPVKGNSTAARLSNSSRACRDV